MITMQRYGFSEAVELLEAGGTRSWLSQIVERMTVKLRGFIAPITPVDTGSMRDSWRDLLVEPLLGWMFIDPMARNTRSGVPVTDYAPWIDQRDGLLDATIAQSIRLAVQTIEEVKWTPR